MAWKFAGSFFANRLPGDRKPLKHFQFFIENALALQVRVSSSSVKPHWYLAGNASFKRFGGNGPLMLPEEANLKIRLGESELDVPSFNQYFVRFDWVHWLSDVQVKVYQLPADTFQPDIQEVVTSAFVFYDVVNAVNVQQLNAVASKLEPGKFKVAFTDFNPQQYSVGPPFFTTEEQISFYSIQNVVPESFEVWFYGTAGAGSFVDPTVFSVEVNIGI